MTVRDVQKEASRQLEQSKKLNARELRNAETDHVGRKEALKSLHRDDIVQIQQENERQLEVEAEKKEKVLQSMKENLQNTQKITEKELANLKKTSESEKIQIREKTTAERARLKEEHELYLDEMNDNFNHKSRNIHTEGENRISQISTAKREEYSDLTNHHETKIDQKTEDFNMQFKKTATDQDRIKELQDRTFKKERTATNIQQQNDMNKMVKIHTDHFEKTDEEFQKEAKVKTLGYEKAYETSLKAHSSDLKTLEETHKKVVTKLKDNLTKEVTKTVIRSDDPFFQLTDINAKMRELEDAIEIRVEVPEHSKQDLRLTTNGKEAILTFSRRFADSHKNAQGVLNSVNKVESFTTKLTSSSILDPKKVTSTYEGGVMTYTIKKA